MRKEVDTTEIAYFCDVCGEEMHDVHWAYGGFATAFEELDRCTVCNAEVCSDCREQPIEDSNKIFCIKCITKNSDTITKMNTIISVRRKKIKEITRIWYKQECVLWESIKAKNENLAR